MLEWLAQGQCAQVYKARWRGIVAVAKVLKGSADYQSGWTLASARADLVHEVSVLSHLRHPNLVLFLGACIDRDNIVLLNEFMDGGNLEEHVLAMKDRHRGVRARLPRKHVARWGLDLAQAITFLHNCNPSVSSERHPTADPKHARAICRSVVAAVATSTERVHPPSLPPTTDRTRTPRQVIHRDLKPANLLLSSQGCLKIGDFGLSSTQRRVVAAGDSYVMTGRTGTIRYMAPEAMEVGHETACTGDGGNKNTHVYARAHTHTQRCTHPQLQARVEGHTQWQVDRDGNSSYNEKVDCYSAAMILWYMCMADPPFGDLEAELIMAGARGGLRPELASVERRHGSVMARTIESCWEADARQRYSAEQLLEQMRQHLALVETKQIRSRSLPGSSVYRWASSAASHVAAKMPNPAKLLSERVFGGRGSKKKGEQGTAGSAQTDSNKAGKDSAKIDAGTSPTGERDAKASVQHPLAAMKKQLSGANQSAEREHEVHSWPGDAPSDERGGAWSAESDSNPHQGTGARGSAVMYRGPGGHFYSAGGHDFAEHHAHPAWLRPLRSGSLDGTHTTTGTWSLDTTTNTQVCLALALLVRERARSCPLPLLSLSLSVSATAALTLRGRLAEELG